MEANVVECLACPRTGTLFLSVITENNVWVTIWCEEGQFMLTGETLVMSENVFFHKGSQEKNVIYIISKFHPNLWKFLKKETQCQGDKKIKPERCTERSYCSFICCPYGLKKH